MAALSQSMRRADCRLFSEDAAALPLLSRAAARCARRSARYCLEAIVDPVDAPILLVMRNADAIGGRHASRLSLEDGANAAEHLTGRFGSLTQDAWPGAPCG